MPDFGMVGLLNGGCFNFKSCVNHFNNHLRSKIHDKASSKLFMTFIHSPCLTYSQISYLHFIYTCIFQFILINWYIVAFVLKNRMAPFGSIL